MHASDNTTLPHFLLKQRYRILHILGEGGMGTVYKAQDIQTQKLVAIKEMHQQGTAIQIEQAIRAFQQEVNFLAQLQHPHLPTIYEHFFEDGRWFLVMFYIEGETLEDYLYKTRQQPLAADEVIDIALQLGSVLEYLHSRKPPIIFRDLKPANIMHTPEGQCYLIDFGIARHFKQGQLTDTVAFGSTGYAPPEQYGKTQSSPRSDIYSLGVTLYQLLTMHDPVATPFQFSFPRRIMMLSWPL